MWWAAACNGGVFACQALRSGAGRAAMRAQSGLESSVFSSLRTAARSMGELALMNCCASKEARRRTTTAKLSGIWLPGVGA